jgi:hypothetical protein
MSFLGAFAPDAHIGPMSRFCLLLIACPFTAYTLPPVSKVTALPRQRSRPDSTVRGHSSPKSALDTSRVPGAGPQPVAMSHMSIHKGLSGRTTMVRSIATAAGLRAPRHD